MVELLQGVKEISGETKHLRCRYFLAVGEKKIGRFVYETYGVKIEDELTGSSCTACDLTVSAARADELLNLLIRNEVTPAGLEDVIADWL